MSTYNPAIAKLDMPSRFARLPIDKRGYPVPKFVTWINGEPDFRVVNKKWIGICRHEERCWLCGEKLGRHLAFVIGPMCSIHRISSEPPSHLDCARFACKACPFMLNPQRRRNEAGLPEGNEQPGGIMIARNPGVALIYITREYRIMKDPGGGLLFSLGEPEKLEWYARGAPATREQIMASINSGLPLLRAMAENEGSKAIEELDRCISRGMALVPAE